MSRWVCKLTVEVQQQEAVTGPQGQGMMVKSQTTHLCGDECYGDTPANAIEGTLEQLKEFFQKLAGTPGIGKES